MIKLNYFSFGPNTSGGDYSERKKRKKKEKKKKNKKEQKPSQFTNFVVASVFLFL